MNSPSHTGEPSVLTSWKEVAAYLGKGVRTVQRWEKNDGLPVRRINGTSKIVVQREDLDRWLRNQPTIADGSLPVHELTESVARSKQLRSQNTVLRAAVTTRVHQLLDECRRMQTAFAPLPDEKTSAGGE